MKLNRNIVALTFCFIFLACGLGLIVAVVALSPSLELFNATQIYVPENTQRNCPNCTVVLISAGTIEYCSIPMLLTLVGMTLGMCSLLII